MQNLQQGVTESLQQDRIEPDQSLFEQRGLISDFELKKNKIGKQA